MEQIAESNKTDYQSPFEDIFDAASKGTVKDVKYFIETKGVNVNERKWDSARCFFGNAYTAGEEYLPIHFAARDNHIEVVKYLISHGADVNATDDMGTTPLDLADSSEKRKVLLEAGGMGKMRDW